MVNSNWWQWRDTNLHRDLATWTSWGEVGTVKQRWTGTFDGDDDVFSNEYLRYDDGHNQGLVPLTFDDVLLMFIFEIWWWSQSSWWWMIWKPLSWISKLWRRPFYTWFWGLWCSAFSSFSHRPVSWRGSMLSSSQPGPGWVGGPGGVWEKGQETLRTDKQIYRRTEWLRRLGPCRQTDRQMRRQTELLRRQTRVWHSWKFWYEWMSEYIRTTKLHEWISEYIHINCFDTNECPN